MLLFDEAQVTLNRLLVITFSPVLVLLPLCVPFLVSVSPTSDLYVFSSPTNLLSVLSDLHFLVTLIATPRGVIPLHFFLVLAEVGLGFGFSTLFFVIFCKVLNPAL